MVVVFIILLDTFEHLNGIGHGGFVDSHRLEAAFQSAVFFDVLAVFVKGGGTDDLDLSPGESRLQDIGRIHRTL